MSAKKVIFIVFSLVCIALSFVFFIWVIQTLWLGSFPNKSKNIFLFWAFVQFLGGVFFLGLPAFFWKASVGRISETSSDKHKDAQTPTKPLKADETPKQ